LTGRSNHRAYRGDDPYVKGDQRLNAGEGGKGRRNQLTVTVERLKFRFHHETGGKRLLMLKKGISASKARKVLSRDVNDTKRRRRKKKSFPLSIEEGTEGGKKEPRGCWGERFPRASPAQKRYDRDPAEKRTRLGGHSEKKKRGRKDLSVVRKKISSN